ncbi:unannotated protein [freshwater metagenome]|uniref:Unannotated protein n=1 Tax=freshwater metagenome TaxID=449393 RepID=A0A6J7HUD6_9ZZZZ
MIDVNYRHAEERTLLRDGLATLAERERLIVMLRFSEGLTQREIAERIGISQMHVSRLLCRSIDQMRAAIAADPAD